MLWGMALPSVVLTGTPKPGNVITATVTRDVAKVQPASTTVALSGTTPGGTATGSLTIVPDPVIEALTTADASAPPRTWTPVSDNGTVAVFTTTA